MFGVGTQELIIIGLLLLVVFGPARVGQMAREVGRFAYKARTSLDEFKAEFTSAEYERPAREEDTSRLTVPNPEESKHTEKISRRTA